MDQEKIEIYLIKKFEKENDETDSSEGIHQNYTKLLFLIFGNIWPPQWLQMHLLEGAFISNIVVLQQEWIFYNESTLK